MDLTTLFAAYGGAILGSALGIFGGVFGTWASIRNTRTPAERRFMIRCSLVVWAGVMLFLVALLVVPQSYNYLL
jgi:zinc transporter ZupT